MLQTHWLPCGFVCVTLGTLVDPFSVLRLHLDQSGGMLDDHRDGRAWVGNREAGPCSAQPPLPLICA